MDSCFTMKSSLLFSSSLIRLFLSFFFLNFSIKASLKDQITVEMLSRMPDGISDNFTPLLCEVTLYSLEN